MAYAVTCTSCGARFSVDDDLFQRKFAGRVVTVRCKQCQTSIVLNATIPPQPNAAPSLLPARPRPVAPRPPLKNPKPETPGPFVALSPGLLGPIPPSREGGLFDAPPSSVASAVDLTEAARSEPPSEAPPLRQLTREAHGQRQHGSEEVDFLLGLSGSPGTTAALLGPPLPQFDPEPAPATLPATAQTKLEIAEPAREPQPTADEDVAPANGAATGGSTAPSKRKRWGLVIAGVSLVAAAAMVRFAVGPRSEDLAAARADVPAELRPRAPRSDGPAARASLDDEPSSAAVATQTAPPAPSAVITPEPVAARPNAPAVATGVPRPAAEKAPNAKSAVETPSTIAKKKSEAAASATTAGRAATTPASPGAAVASAPAGPFSRAAAASALNAAAAEASACKKPGDPSGTASVTLTFAPSGRVTSATISGPPFAGTATGGCIAATLRRARVPAFDGDKVTVGKTVLIR